LLVLLCGLKLCEVLTNYVLHLNRVEILLVGDHITQTRFDVFKLLKLDNKHVAQPLHVFLDVVVGHAAVQLVENCVEAALELLSVLGDALVVFLVGLGVLFEPVFAVVDHLIHPGLVLVVSLLVPAEVLSHVAKQLLELCLSPQEDLLDLTHVFLVLVEFVFQHVNSINLSLEIDLGSGDFFINRLELLNVINARLVNFLFLTPGHKSTDLPVTAFSY
jgi:hypothetical protein